jgi:hypothetical protein
VRRNTCMVKKRDSAAQRLRALAEQNKGLPSLALQLEALEVRIGMLSQRQDWSNPLEREAAANLALRIAEPEIALKKAFEQFDLDPDDPFSWHRLLNYFAESHFGSKGPGAPTKWTGDQNANLLGDRIFIIRKHLNLLTRTAGRSREKKVRELMRKEPLFLGRYKDSKDDTMKRQIKSAIKWAKKAYRAGLDTKADQKK